MRALTWHGKHDVRVDTVPDPEDADRTSAEAHGLWWLVNRPNLFIKIPATVAALPAITECLADGISVNVTLIFSLERYSQVINAFLSGLEQRLADGGKLAGIESVASFFVSRVDTEVDRRLAQIVTTTEDSPVARQLQGQVAIANARLAYQLYEEMLASARWKALAERGARPQRLLWASTGVKDKSADDTRYVAQLAAPDTVNTMPEATLNAVMNHGQVSGDMIRGTYEAARKVMADLEARDIEIADVTAALEAQGLASFSKSWEQLITSVTAQIEKAGAQVTTSGATRPANGEGRNGTPAVAAPG